MRSALGRSLYEDNSSSMRLEDLVVLSPIYRFETAMLDSRAGRSSWLGPNLSNNLLSYFVPKDAIVLSSADSMRSFIQMPDPFRRLTWTYEIYISVVTDEAAVHDKR